MISAETAYSFRHALLRDAAYQLQLPGDRARLHGLAFLLIEDLCGGAPPLPLPLTLGHAPPVPPHPSDPFAQELALHARLASTAPPQRESLYLRRASEVAEKSFRYGMAEALWQALADRIAGPERGIALLRAAAAAYVQGRMQAAEALQEQALGEFRGVGHRQGEGAALSSRGLIRQNTGRIELSRKDLEAALALQRSSGDRHGEGVTLNSLATLRREQGNMEEARALFRAALRIHKELGNRRSEGVARQPRDARSRAGQDA
ncbi:MAG: tetratricopeptide repeat protein [Planctomycetes bacterium]|nr:tetratricopeptide repeat protein [Planctomycetota bacterium]